MDRWSHEVDQFKKQMRESLFCETKNSNAITVARHANVYSVGDEGEAVYFIEHGQIKLTMPSHKSGDCLLAVYTSGDIFGELSLSEPTCRLNTAMAMEDTSLKRMPYGKFIDHLRADSGLRGFIRYLAVRMADQQVVIANLVTVDSEQRLGQTLLQLAGKLGLDSRSIRQGLRISQEELSRMVGTTRPRISGFMQRFRALGLLEITTGHYIVINKKKLTSYLESIV